MSKADYSIETADAGHARLILKGPWLITELHGFAVRLRALLSKIQHVDIDSQQLETLDTAGALLLPRICLTYKGTASLLEARVGGGL